MELEKFGEKGWDCIAFYFIFDIRIFGFFFSVTVLRFLPYLQVEENQGKEVEDKVCR